jgi:tetratricopeptide (TPR) repeat protein
MKDWGRYKESLNYDTQLYDLSLKKFGEHDERVADAARQLARTHYLSGRYQVAIGYYAKNLTIRKLLYGDQHPQTAVALNCLGMANKVLGNYEEGMKMYQHTHILTNWIS